MTCSPEYNYWDPNNKKLEIPDELMPSWVALLNSAEAVLADLKVQRPELFNEDGTLKE